MTPGNKSLRAPLRDHDSPLGRTGRGICEHFGVDPREVDFIVGTLSKTFACSGGFIAGRRRVIDWLRFTMLLVGSRVSFAALNDTFARLQNRRMPHVLVIGAGDVGEIVLRSLIRSRPAAYPPVGFIDPDPGTRNRTMHGVRVLD